MIFLQFIFTLVLGLMCAIMGYESGQDIGRKEACTSIHAEWVKDKCMKVTREEVK